MGYGLIGALAIGVSIALYYAMKRRRAVPTTSTDAANIATRPAGPATPSWIGDLRIETVGRRGAWLEILEGPQVGRTYFLGERTLTIGRGTTHSIQLSDRDVSRSHCRVAWSAGSYTVSDMGSGNGTWVNGDRIDSVQIKDGDDLRVGTTVFRFLEEVVFQVDYSLAHKELGGVYETATRSVDLDEASEDGGVSMKDRLLELARLTKATREGLSGEAFFEAIAISLQEHIGAHRSVVLQLVDGNWDLRSFHHARDLESTDVRIPPDKPLMSQVAQSGRSGATKALAAEPGLLCAMATPVRREGAVAGVLYADRVGQGESEFGPKDLEYLEAMADLIATTS